MDSGQPLTEMRLIEFGPTLAPIHPDWTLTREEHGMTDKGLPQEVLDGFVRHAREAHLESDPLPLLSDRIELLVGEVRRLREGIRDAAESVDGWHDSTRDQLLSLLDEAR